MKLTKLKRLGIFVFILLTVGCTYYSTLQLSPINEKLVNDMYENKKIIFVHTNNEQHQHLLTSVEVHENSISGVIEKMPSGYMHEPHDYRFKKGQVSNFNPLETIHIYSKIREIQIGKIEIPFQDIKNIEIHEENFFAKIVNIILLILVSLFALIVLGFYALLAFISTLNSDCTCPFVESYNATETEFHGSLFPGAIFKSLQRDDYLLLDDVIMQDGELKLRVFNNMPEIEYIDQLTLLEIKYPGFDYLGLNEEGVPIAYNLKKIINSEKAPQSKLSKIQLIDDQTYSFDEAYSEDNLSSIEISFNRKDFVNEGQLIIRGKQSPWLEKVANYTFYKTGKSFNKWVERKDNANPKSWYNEHEKQGIALNVYLKIDGKWDYVGSFHDAGTLRMRNLAMALNLEKIDSDLIEIKLESAYHLWELDYVGLTDSWSSDLEIQKIPFFAAIDETGKDILSQIENVDKIFHVQKNKGSNIELKAQNIQGLSQSSIVLKGNGYYHHLRNFEHSMDVKELVKMNQKRGIHKLSKEMKYYADIAQYVSFIE